MLELIQRIEGLSQEHDNDCKAIPISCQNEGFI
jgi:hypothetical protein